MKSGQGMALGEFLYPVLQSWDWWHMYHSKGIQVQIGGSDQYGNIIAGIEAIKYINKTHHDPDHRQVKEEFLNEPMGLTVPLLTTGSGEKFGKSLGNAIWLDKDMTSTFDLYQVCQLNVSLSCTILLTPTVVLPPHYRRGCWSLLEIVHVHTDRRD